MFKKEVVFIKDFSSAVYGNVWVGRKLVVKTKDAELLIKNKLAKIVEKKEAVKVAKEIEAPVKQEVKNVTDKPKRSQRTSKSRNKRG